MWDVIGSNVYRQRNNLYNRNMPGIDFTNVFLNITLRSYRETYISNIGGTKELVVLLWLSGDIWYRYWTKRVGSPFVNDYVKVLFRCF